MFAANDGHAKPNKGEPIAATINDTASVSSRSSRNELPAMDPALATALRTGLSLSSSEENIVRIDRAFGENEALLPLSTDEECCIRSRRNIARIDVAEEKPRVLPGGIGTLGPLTIVEEDSIRARREPVLGALSEAERRNVLSRRNMRTLP